MRVAVGQMGATDDKAANLRAIGALAAEAADRGARMLVLPEGAMVHFRDRAHPLVGEAEPLDGPFVGALRELAAHRGLTLVCGLFEPCDASRVYNTVVVVDPEGGLVGHYRKIHLYDAFGYRESDRIRAGDGAVVTFDLGGITFGVMTCYGLRFPELARRLVDGGAEAIVLPAGWVHGLLKEEHWEVLLRARAIENTVYVLAADQVGDVYVGSSMVVDPLGVVKTRAGEEPELLLCELSADRIRQVRETVPTLRHRRFEVTPKG